MDRMYQLISVAKKQDVNSIKSFDDMQTVNLGDAFDKADDVQMSFSGTYSNLHVLACQNAIAIANKIPQKPGKIDTNATIHAEVYGYEQPETQTHIAGTPLDWAMGTDSIEMAVWLVENGASFRMADMVKAVDKRSYILMKKFLEKGGNCRQTYDSGNTLLHDACRKESYEIVELLISHGANVNALNIIKKTPYYYTKSKSIKNLLRNAGAKKPWWQLW